MSIDENRFFKLNKQLFIKKDNLKLSKFLGNKIPAKIIDSPPVVNTKANSYVEEDEKLPNIINKFVSGNMTRFEAEQELDELGINCASNDDANDRVLNFEYNNKKYQITCSRVAANDGKGGNVVEIITPAQVDAIVQKYGDEVKHYFKAVAVCDGEVIAYALDFSNWPEGVNKTLAALETKLTEPKDSDEQKAIKEFIDTYTNSETDLDGADFDKLENLLKAANITYTTEQATVLGKVIRGIKFEFSGITYNFYSNETPKAGESGNNNSDVTGGGVTTNGTVVNNSPSENKTPAADFASYKELRNYIFGNARTVISATGITFTNGFSYEHVADTVAKTHEQDFATVTKEQLIEEFKTEYNNKLTGYAGGTDNGASSVGTSGAVETVPSKTPSGDFASYKELRNYIFGNAARTVISATGITFTKGFGYENIADAVAKAHEQDFATVTKEQLIEEFKTEYNNKLTGYAGGTDNGASSVGTSGAVETTPSKENKDVVKEVPVEVKATTVLEVLVKNESGIRANRISSTIYSLEQAYASNNSQNTKVNTAYSLDSNGNVKFSNTFVKTMFDDLYTHIKEVVGTDVIDEKTLKQLYQTAWLMSYAKYNSSQENDISDFLTQVYNNFKLVLTRLKEKPEYLELFTGKVVNGENTVETRAVNIVSQSVGGGSVKCDKTAKVYNDGSIHVSDDESDANLQKAVKTLIEKLQKAYPDIPSATLTKMVYDAVKDAIENIGNIRYTKIPNNFTVFNELRKEYPRYTEAQLSKVTKSISADANTIMSLATYYFEQNLYNAALTDNNLTNGNVVTEPKTITVDDATKAKYKKAESYIKVMLSDIYDSSHIKGLLVNNGCDGAHWLEMDVDSNGNFRFSDNKTKTAYDKLFAEMKTKSAFANSGLTEAEFKQIYNAAWLDSYNGYDNNQKYNLSDVLNKVVANMQKILSKLSTNPEYLNLIKSGSSMTKVSSGITTSVSYKYTKIERDFGDGNVHLSNDNSDKEYQKVIEEFKTKLKDSYVPPLSESQFASWFLQAQKDAISTCMNRTRDITKDLQVNHGTRKDDGSNIKLAQLMELIAYKFDKIMYKNVFGAA